MRQFINTFNAYVVLELKHIQLHKFITNLVFCFLLLRIFKVR